MTKEEHTDEYFKKTKEFHKWLKSQLEEKI